MVDSKQIESKSSRGRVRRYRGANVKLSYLEEGNDRIVEGVIHSANATAVTLRTTAKPSELSVYAFDANSTFIINILRKLDDFVIYEETNGNK